MPISRYAPYEGSSREWVAANPRLRRGEAAFDEYGVKVGNGVDRWSGLTYSSLVATVQPVEELWEVGEANTTADSWYGAGAWFDHFVWVPARTGVIEGAMPDSETEPDSYFLITEGEPMPLDGAPFGGTEMDDFGWTSSVTIPVTAGVPLYVHAGVWGAAPGKTVNVGPLRNLLDSYNAGVPSAPGEVEWHATESGRMVATAKNNGVYVSGPTVFGRVPRGFAGVAVLESRLLMVNMAAAQANHPQGFVPNGTVWYGDVTNLLVFDAAGAVMNQAKRINVFDLSDTTEPDWSPQIVMAANAGGSGGRGIMLMVGELPAGVTYHWSNPRLSLFPG